MKSLRKCLKLKKLLLSRHDNSEWGPSCKILGL
jgi:hypothetical protein